jgi:hypothetical protein
MPSIDTVISFGVAKASRFGLLQHPITLTSQMATLATDRKAAGRDIAMWSKLLRQPMWFGGWSTVARRAILKRLD